MVTGGIALAALASLIFSVLVLYLWNWLMPALFGLKAISFWQAFGLVLLCKILFSGMGHAFSHDHLMTHVEMMDRKKRRLYNSYWEENGRDAFEAYVRKMDTDKTKDQ